VVLLVVPSRGAILNIREAIWKLGSEKCDVKHENAVCDPVSFICDKQVEEESL
jgi:hypothetical protein